MQRALLSFALSLLAAQGAAAPAQNAGKCVQSVSLDNVAAFAARWRADHGSLPPNEELIGAIRKQNASWVWPRAWAISGETAAAEAPVRLGSWLASLPVPAGRWLCGKSSYQQVVAAVAVDELAQVSLGPIPRAAGYVPFEAHLTPGASAPQLILMGPAGLPTPVLASFREGTLRASLPIDRDGLWMVQALADVGQGPRPVAESWLSVGRNAGPPELALPAPLPGASDTLTMLSWLNIIRKRAGSPALLLYGPLQKLAIVQAELMRKQSQVGHDLGAGSPRERAERSGISARFIGENVATAGSLDVAFRALWMSPSHRGNMLDARLTHVGLGIVRAPAGQVFVAQMYGGGLQ